MILLRGLYKTALSRWCGVAIALASLAAPGCAVRRTTKVNPSLVPPPSQQTTLTDLVGRVNAWSSSIRTLIATTDLEPQTGSVYSGVIRQNHGDKGYILLAKPPTIRNRGPAHTQRTKTVDMGWSGAQLPV